MSKIQTSMTGDQKLSTDGGFTLVKNDLGSCCCCHFGSLKTCCSPSDDCQIHKGICLKIKI